MLFRQFVDDDLGCASYLIGDPDTGEGVVVDPAYAIEQYLEAGLRITRVLETHTHADHVSGHGRLALEHGATVYVHPAAEPEFPFEPIEDGTEIEVGDVRIRVMHTPGHRPEHCVFVVDEQIVLTGDSLFVGDVARPDLAVRAHEGAEGLFHSLRRVTELPDDVAVYPGHVAGSLCGSGMSSDPSSSIGRERRTNRALALGDVRDFVAELVGRKSPRPPNMDRIVRLNRGPFVGAPRELEALSSANGLTVLDVRDARDFTRGHLPGAFNVPVSGSSFATKAGFVLSSDEPVAIFAGSREEAERAARGLRVIGFLDLAGYIDSLAAVERIDPIELEELERLLADGRVEVVDVREADERDRGYIAGSRHIPYRLLRACGDDLPRDRPVVTICESGARAAIAASVLAASGVEARPVLDGGVSAWQARGGTTVEFRRCG